MYVDKSWKGKPHLVPLNR